MDFEGNGLLTATVFLPLVGALLIAVLVRNDRHVRFVAGATIVLDLALSVLVFTGYDLGKGGVQLVDRAPGWIPIDSFKVEYFLGVDGLSAPLVLLTGLLGFVAVFASWSIKERLREYFVWLLVLQTAVMGVFTALDFILFFLLWELEMAPMFLPHLNLGERTARILGDEVPDLHLPRQRLHARGHSDYFLLDRHVRHD